MRLSRFDYVGRIRKTRESGVTESAVLALEDGTVFKGRSVGVSGQTVGEVVFNTAMTGYQEILNDPSYFRQLVTLTYPHIGNTGTNATDFESPQIYAAGLIVRDLSMAVSNWRSESSLEDYLCRGDTVAIADIDTRQLTRIIRDKGAQGGCILAGPDVDPERAVHAARQFPGLKGWTWPGTSPPTHRTSGMRAASGHSSRNRSSRSSRRRRAQGVPSLVMWLPTTMGSSAISCGGCPIRVAE